MESVVIGDNVKTISEMAFANCSRLNDVYVQFSTPIEINENTFDDEIYEKATLHVPSGSQQDYSTAEYWKSFIHIVDDVNPSAVLLPKTDEEPLMIFDINGHRRHRLAPGINIIKMNNGKNRKVVVNHGG